MLAVEHSKSAGDASVSYGAWKSAGDTSINYRAQ
jgi:hypothetical protein